MGIKYTFGKKGTGHRWGDLYQTKPPGLYREKEAPARKMLLVSSAP
jgi:hypothetical protein